MNTVARIQGLLTRNVGLKLLSLVTAVVLFFAVRGAEDAQRAVFVEVVAQTPAEDSGHMLVSELPAKVRLTLRGSSSQLSSIRTEEMDPVEITLVDTSLSYYYFEPAGFDLPAGVRVEAIAPSTVPLVWAERGQRTLPIEVRLVGEPREGYSLFGEPTAEPGEVTVTGPESEVAAMVAVETDPIQLGAYGEGGHTEVVRLRRAPDHVRYTSRESVRARFQITAEVSDRSFAGLSVLQVGGQSRLTIRPPVITAVVRGTPDQVDAMGSDMIVPYIDVAGVTPGVGAEPVQVQLQELPEGVQLVRVEPPQVFVTSAARPGRAEPSRRPASSER